MAINTTRLAIAKPQGTDDAKIPLYIGGMADILDSACIALRGTLANRPAAGLQGRIYDASDDLVYLDTGSAWEPIAGMTNWTSFSYSGTWTNAGSAAYKKTDTDIIFRGSVSKPTVPTGGETIATLPAGSRPTVASLFTCPTNLTGYLCKITVNVDGTVVYNAPLVDGGSNPGNINLAGIRFPWA